MRGPLHERKKHDRGDYEYSAQRRKDTRSDGAALGFVAGIVFHFTRASIHLKEKSRKTRTIVIISSNYKKSSFNILIAFYGICGGRQRILSRLLFIYPRAYKFYPGHALLLGRKCVQYGGACFMRYVENRRL
jgi:hypothetical protein